MDVTRADAHQPGLGVGDAGAQPVARPQFTRVDLVRARLDIDGNELALVPLLQMRTDVGFVNGVTAPGELLFAVPRSGCGHGILWFPIQRALDRPRPYCTRHLARPPHRLKTLAIPVPPRVRRPGPPTSPPAPPRWGR